MEYYHSPLFAILVRQAVALLTTRSQEFSRFLKRLSPGDVGPVRCYPDGSLDFDEGEFLDEFERILIGSGLQGAEITDDRLSRSLASFPKQRYRIFYTGEYQDKLGEDGFLSGAKLYAPESPDESRLDDLLVTIGFRRRTNQEVRRRFVATISDWGRSVAAGGMFGEGPARILSDSVEFSGARAQFRIDASRSGQRTLNWLALTVLGFGYEVATTTGILYGNCEHLDELLGVPGRACVLAFPSPTQIYANGSVRTDAGSVTDDPVPAAAAPHSSLDSKRFRVMDLARDSWEEFCLTVYFAHPLDAEARSELARLLDGWITLARYGGFGGTSIKDFGAVEFDGTAESAVLRANMIDANPLVALPLLIRILEGFDYIAAPIDAVVFGEERRGSTEGLARPPRH